MSVDQTPVRRPVPITQRDGSSLQNSNCRMASVSTGLDFHTVGKKVSTGAKMRAHQDDQSGGTDSRDAKQAWDRGYSQALRIEDGSPWSDALAALRAGRAVNLDVWHETVNGPCLSGSGRYGHNIFVLPDCKNNAWLVSDPWCKPASWVRVSEAKLRAGAEEWGRRVFDSAGMDTGIEVEEPRDTAGDTNPQTPEEFQEWLARAAKRLMERYRPGQPAPTGEGDADPDSEDTGGAQAVLFTTTNIQPLKEDYVDLYGVADKSFVATKAINHYDKPGGTKTGTIPAGATTVYQCVAADKNPATATPGWYLINGGSTGIMRWVKAADL